MVADGARKYFRHCGSGLGQTFDKPDGGHGGPEDARHEDGQQAVNQLGGDIHKHRDQAQSPNAPWQGSQCKSFRAAGMGG